jgi:hypothetical protein
MARVLLVSNLCPTRKRGGTLGSPREIGSATRRRKTGGEQVPCNGHLRHLENNVAPMADDLRAVLDQLFLERRQRPLLDRFRRGQDPLEIAEIIGGCVELKTHGVGGEGSRHLRQRTRARSREGTGSGLPSHGGKSRWDARPIMSENSRGHPKINVG